MSTRGAALAADKNSAKESGAARVSGPRARRIAAAIAATGPRAKDPWAVERWRKRIRKRNAPPERARDRMPGDLDPREMAARDRELSTPVNMNPRAAGAGRAFDLTAEECARLANAQARAGACRRGSGITIEHVPCGARYMIRFGCRTRVCDDCGDKYRATKRARFEPLMRLHVKAGEKSKLKFLTLTFPNIEWDTATECREWFKAKTKLLRRIFDSRHTPYAWGVRGYLAVWEVTAERECASCHQARSRHDENGAGCKGNTCEKWIEGPATGRWHPHLHVLIWSNFIALDERIDDKIGREHRPRNEYLRHVWSDATGGRQIRIEPVHGKKAVGYILDYIGKGWDGVPDDFQLAALYRIRRITSVGEFYGKRFEALTARLMTAEEKHTWRLVCTRCDAREAPNPRPIREIGKPFVWETVALDVGESPPLVGWLGAPPDAPEVMQRIHAATGIERQKDGPRVWFTRSDTQWATVDVGIELRDLLDADGAAWLPVPAARMAEVRWNGVLEHPRWETQAVKLAVEPLSKEEPCPF